MLEIFHEMCETKGNDIEAKAEIERLPFIEEGSRVHTDWTSVGLMFVLRQYNSERKLIHFAEESVKPPQQINKYTRQDVRSNLIQ